MIGRIIHEIGAEGCDYTSGKETHDYPSGKKHLIIRAVSRLKLIDSTTSILSCDRGHAGLCHLLMFHSPQ